MLTVCNIESYIGWLIENCLWIWRRLFILTGHQKQNKKFTSMQILMFLANNNCVKCTICIPSVLFAPNVCVISVSVIGLLLLHWIYKLHWFKIVILICDTILVSNETHHIVSRKWIYEQTQKYVRLRCDIRK